MRKKTLFIIFVISLILTGCWSRTEVNDIAIVLGAAIDKAENENLRLSLQIAIPKGLGPTATNQGKATILISAEGKNIMEVYRLIQEKIPREILKGVNECEQ